MVLMEEVVIMMPGVEIGKPATQIMEARGGTRVPDTEEEGEEEVISTLREKKVGLEPWRNLEEFSQSSSRVTSRRGEERTKITEEVVATAVVKIGEIEVDGETPSGRRSGTMGGEPEGREQEIMEGELRNGRTPEGRRMDIMLLLKPKEISINAGKMLNGSIQVMRTVADGIG